MSTSGGTLLYGVLVDDEEEATGGLPLHLYAIVLASACLHASWNFVIRSTKGNTGVVLSAYCINCPLLGLVCYSRYDIWTDMNMTESWQYVIATGVIHAVYLVAVALAYQQGNMSIVYPVARGTGAVQRHEWRATQPAAPLPQRQLSWWQVLRRWRPNEWRGHRRGHLQGALLPWPD